MENSQDFLRCKTPTSPETIVALGKKRKLSTSSNDDDQPAVKYLELDEVFTLERFSDEVLFEIFKHLNTPSIYALKKTCRRFWGIVQDHRLWRDIDTLAHRKTVDSLREILERAHKKTNSIKISGFLGEAGQERDINHENEKQCLLKLVIPKCENLTDLELQSVFIDFSAIQIQDFPKDLRRLVFRDVYVRWPDNAPTVFQKLDKSLLWLEELRVESCTWFHPYDIMLFSKCPSLKFLSLRGCQNLSDFVPYGSMASRFGFKKLEHLDVRDTPITDSDLQCFNAVLTLKELLLQCPVRLRKKVAEDSKSSLDQLVKSNHFSNFISCISSSGSSSSSSSSLNSTLSDTAECAEPPAEDQDDARPSTSRQRNPREPANVLMSIDLQNHTRMVYGVCGSLNTDFRRLRHPDNPQGSFSSFWDMIYRQTGPDGRHFLPQKSQISPISNRGVSCFGRPTNPVDQNIIWIRIGDRPNNNSFERLYLRHYQRVTDDSLLHLAQCSPRLVYLDVTGSGVTQEGIEQFKARKPNCEIIFEDFDD
ncbi:uncharacterized protein LOC129941911 [Eupeodes corollae]|uniref:uncharacterized protein LOC129941911 n=1 Tax=Eupeodes corollae TaxID=290404 RepID=UPI00248FE9FF|nr:uncharacterized protein LOC129941911 [Eupeodes corollae]